MPLSPYLRDKLVAKLDAMTDERAFQVLDYVEFLDSKYARREPPTGAAGLIAKLQETVEDGLRAGKVNASTVAETLGFMQKAVSVVSGVAAAGQSVAGDLATVATRAVQEVGKVAQAAQGSARPAGGGDAAWGTGGAPGTTAAAAPPTSPAADGTTAAPADGGAAPHGDAAATNGSTSAPVEGPPPPPRNWWEQR